MQTHSLLKIIIARNPLQTLSTHPIQTQRTETREKQLALFTISFYCLLKSKFLVKFFNVSISVEFEENCAATWLLTESSTSGTEGHPKLDHGACENRFEQICGENRADSSQK